MPDVRAVEDLREGAGGRMALVGASSRGLVAPPCSRHSRRTNAQELQTATEEEVQKMMIPPGHVRRMEGRTTKFEDERWEVLQRLHKRTKLPPKQSSKERYEDLLKRANQNVDVLRAVPKPLCD